VESQKQFNLRVADAMEAGETYEVVEVSVVATTNLPLKGSGLTQISLRKILHRIGTAWRLGRERYWQRRQLMEMDEHQLKDIGITREQAEQEGRKPIWKG
jgi:uncharacterized protein YjiS (DUF1127 family)